MIQSCSVCGTPTPLVCADCGKVRCHKHSAVVASVARCSGGCESKKKAGKS